MRFFGIILCFAALSGCAVAPAKLRLRSEVTGSVRRESMAVAQVGATEKLLAEYLAAWKAAPESAGGMVAGGRFVRLWKKSGLPGQFQLAGGRVSFAGDWKATYFDELLPAADYDVRGLKERHVRAGRGVPLVGIRPNTRREAIESLYPPEAITRPVNARLQASSNRQVTIVLGDPLRDESLAADFTAPFVSLLSRAGTLQGTAVGGLMNADGTRRDHMLYLMEPYDPRKTPVILVHGLLSTPLAWASLTNDLWGDPEFRRRYQVWHHLYPTSAPFLYSAKLFRQRLTEARKLVDPQGTDPASRKMMIVAHSMGGLLTRTLITESGEDIWNAVFMVPPSAVEGSKEDCAEVQDILHWKPRREVREVIFIAVPHRGSDMALNFVGRIGDLLAGLPKRFIGLYARLNRDNPGALRPQFRDALSRGRLTSIDSLSPRHPTLGIMDRKPFAPWVKVHSIIGDRGRKGPIAASSDGVVPYTSSHLGNAVSELIVPTGHGAYEHPKAVGEILRILNQ